MKVLAVDIGATKTSIAPINVENNYHVYRIFTYHTINIADMYDYIQMHAGGNDGISVGIPGVPYNGRIKLTNLPGQIFDSADLNQQTGIDVLALNDVESAAHYMPLLNRSGVRTVYGNEEPPQQETKILLLPGTGLGGARALWTDDGYFIERAEPGHFPYIPENWRERGWLEYLEKKFERKLVMEDLCARYGPIYLDLLYERVMRRPETMEEMAESWNIGQNIDVFKKWCSLLAHDTQIFAFGGDMPFGGVYLGANVTKNQNVFMEYGSKVFVDEFQSHPKMSESLRRIPIYVITDHYFSLKGNAAAYMKHFGDKEEQRNNLPELLAEVKEFLQQPCQRPTPDEVLQSARERWREYIEQHTT